MRDRRHTDKFPFLGNGLFYEPNGPRSAPSQEYLDVVRSRCGDNGWNLVRDGFWVHAEPEHVDLPPQGWKIHISATLDNAEDILARVSSFLVAKGTAFKFAMDRRTLAMLNYKNWHRGSSGKFITIYPSGLMNFKELLEELHALLKNEEGPYILSDRRYRQSKVLYYRYGGIRKHSIINLLGEEVPVLVGPTGERIQDNRLPHFSPPPWVLDPFAQNTKSDHRKPQHNEAYTLNQGAYRITSALAFSNTGGVYSAQSTTTGETVVIKEARPYTAMDDLGNEAVALLRKEYDILCVLQHTGITPKPLDYFQQWEHHFLVEEYIEGRTLREYSLTANPLTMLRPTITDTEAFYSVFEHIFVNFAKALQVVHSHNIVLGDLSANNLIIKPDSYELKFIDLEGAFRIGVDKPTYLFTPGFRKEVNVRAKVQTTSDDLFTLGVIMFYFLFPIAAMSALRADIYDNVLGVILRDLGWPRRVYNVINRLTSGRADCGYVIRSLKRPARFKRPVQIESVNEGSAQKMLNKLGEFVLANVEHRRDDRLFPADPFLYRTNPLSIGFGASGVLYALHKCDFAIPRRARTWLEKRLEQLDSQRYPPGLLTGLAGISWALWDLGYHEKALQAADAAVAHTLLHDHHSLFYGSAGVGMLSLHLYRMTAKMQYLDQAVLIADQLLKRSITTDSHIYWRGTDGTIHLGYGYGQSGTALYLLRLWQVTGEKCYKLYGEQALEYDMSYKIEQERDLATFPAVVGDSSTFEPYLEVGSAGIMRVLLRYGKNDRIHGMVNDVHRKYSVFCGALYGLASFLEALTDLYLATNEEKYLHMCERPITGIQQLYLLKTPKGYATPGDSLFRVSCDYATGVAGVMRALHRYVTKDQADFTLDEVS